jgi:acyl dehydratase
MTTMWAEDFTPGTTFRSQGRTILEADIASFAAWSWDTNPVHTDAVSAASGRFGTPIAHGLLGMSVAMGLVARIGVFEGSSIALLGVDEWRFLLPIRAGDTVVCEVEILAVRRTSSGDAVVDRMLRLIDDGGQVLQEGRIGLLVSARPSEG